MDKLGILKQVNELIVKLESDAEVTEAEVYTVLVNVRRSFQQDNVGGFIGEKDLWEGGRRR